MADFEGILAERLSLVDAVDHLLNKGVVLTGTTTLSLAGVDLVYIGLNLLVASVETLREFEGGGGGPTPPGRLPKGRGGIGPTPDPSALPLASGAGESASADADVALPLPLGRGPGGRSVSSSATSPLPQSGSGLYAASQTPSTAQPPPGDAPAVLPLAGLPERLTADADERPERGLARLVLTLIELLRQVVERQALRRAEGGALPDEQVERMGVALMELEAKMAELRAAFDLSDEDLNLDLGPLGRLM